MRRQILASFVQSLHEVVIIYLKKLFLKLLLCYYFGFVTRVLFDFGVVDNPLKQFLSFWKIQSQESHNTCGHGRSMTFLSFIAPVISNVAEQQISKEIDLHVLFKKPRF